MAAPMGENAYLVTLERYLLSRGGHSPDRRST